MRKIWTFIILSVTAVGALYWLGMQIAYIHVEHMLEWAVVNNSLFLPTTDPKYLFFDEQHYYIWLLNLLAAGIVIEIFLNTIFSKSERELRKNRRLLTPEEKKNHTHLSSKHEAKKGMTRMQFDRFGHLRDKTPVQAAGIFCRMIYVWLVLGLLKGFYNKQLAIVTKENSEEASDELTKHDNERKISQSNGKKLNLQFITMWINVIAACTAALLNFGELTTFREVVGRMAKMINGTGAAVWSFVSRIHAAISFISDPYAKWILSVLIWCLCCIVIFKLAVVAAALCIHFLDDHLMPAVPGYKLIKRLIIAAALFAGGFIRLNKNLFINISAWYLLLTCILQLIDFVSSFILTAVKYKPTEIDTAGRLLQITDQMTILHSSFSVLKKSAGLREKECQDDKLYPESIIRLYRACTFRNTIDEIFDGVKKFWNRICTILEFPDAYKMNTIKKYRIGDASVSVRGGLPILSYWRKIYVDADDDHTLIVSSSKSGKSWSFILIFIDACRMAGESMIINDPKAEILAEKYQSLIDDDYDVRRVNFINPEESDGYNPLDIIVKSYLDEKRVYKEKLQQLQSEKDRILKALEDPDSDKVVNEAKLDAIEADLRDLHVDHSKSDIYINNLKQQLTYDKESKDKTWDSSSGDVIAGLIYMLLEEFDREDSDIRPEHINFKNIQALYNEGVVTVKSGKDHVTKLSQWLKLKVPKVDKSFNELSAYATAADPTRKSIDVSYKKNTGFLNIDEGVQKLLAKSTFDFKDIGRKKTAVFIVVHGDVSTYYPLVTLMVDQMYTQLMELAREQYAISGKERLPVPVTMILDEFGIFPPLNSISNIITFARSAGIRMVMACQDFNQLANTYGDYVAKILQNNSMNFVYLMGQEPETLQRIENMCGFKLKWSNETKRYEKVPTVTKERLGTLSVGEALIKMQRHNPLVTRFRGYDRYIFYKNMRHGYEFQGEKLPPVEDYDLAEKLQQRLRIASQIDRRNAEAANLNAAKSVQEHKGGNVLGELKPDKPKEIKKAQGWGYDGWKNNNGI